MNIQQLSIEQYDKMSLKEKTQFYHNIIPEMDFIPAIRLKRTKNMKTRGDKQIDGKLTFIDELRRVDKKVTNFSYLCICECGNWTIVTNRHFDLKDIISCGCYRKARGAQMCKTMGTEHFIDMTNQIYGDLKVIRKTEERMHEGIVWECECVKCGHVQKVQGRLLRLGTKSFCERCSLRKSKGERLIANLLTISNLEFEREKTFNNCRFPNTNRLAVFDFYVNNEYIIEYDGEQHFSPQRFNNITEEEAKNNFQKLLKRDNYKNQWCKEQNIPLIRIPYTHLEQLCIKDILNNKDNQFLLNCN